MGDYQVIAKNLPKVEQSLHKEWSLEPGYSIMRQFIGTEDNPPQSCDGDAFVIKDALESYGCIWGVDFYIRRTTK